MSAVTLPTLLTLVRIALIVPICGLFLVGAGWADWLILGLFVAATVTDWLDGALARRWGCETRLGRCLDPLADKLLVAAVLVLLVGTDRLAPVSSLAAVVIVLRELLVSGLREALAGQAVLPVTLWAKVKTAVQMTALGLLLLPPDLTVLAPLRLAGEIGLWAAAALTAVTGWHYLRISLSYLTEDRENQGTAGDGS